MGSNPDMLFFFSSRGCGFVMLRLFPGENTVVMKGIMETDETKS